MRIAVAIGVLLDGKPLLEKNELGVFAEKELLGQLLLPLLQDDRVPPANLRGPLGPGRFSKMAPQGPKQGVVVEPVRLVGAESVEGLPAFGRSAVPEAAGGTGQGLSLEVVDEPEVGFSLRP